jgi:L-iditol 2-dehydrogenase
MLAVTKTDQYRELTVQDVEPKPISSGEVLIKVDCCGVCGSDLHAYNNAPGYEEARNRILGHEICGTVIEVFGNENPNLLNKRVVVESIQGCGRCFNCTHGKSHICETFNVIGLHYDGGMAEFVKCPARFVQEVPEDLPGVLGALIEPMTIAVHAVEYVAKVKPSDRVLVQGPGIIGFFAGLACKEIGATVILSGLPKDYEARLKHASKFGMETYIVGESNPLPEKVDVLIECSGSHKALDQGLGVIKKGGKAVLVAIYEEKVNLFLTSLVRHEISLLGSYGSKSDEYSRALQVIQRYSSQLEDIITVYPLSDAPKAFEDALHQKVLKPILQNQS